MAAIAYPIWPSAKVFLHRRKYEVLLWALIQHLFISVLLTDLPQYARFIWPVNMVLLGWASIAIFPEDQRWKHTVRILLSVLVVALPLLVPVFGHWSRYFLVLNIAYVAFFSFLFFELLRFLIKPGYINADLISAAACGYFLLIELAVFLLQFCQYANPHSFKGLDTSTHGATFIDMVYFCSITITSIGFGDITPATHQTKLITSLFGIAGQFYNVVLVGILISKFAASERARD